MTFRIHRGGLTMAMHANRLRAVRTTLPISTTRSAS
jgi:hypothetical protein